MPMAPCSTWPRPLPPAPRPWASRPPRWPGSGATSSCNTPGCAPCRDAMRTSPRSPPTRWTSRWTPSASTTPRFGNVFSTPTARRAPTRMPRPRSRRCMGADSASPSCPTVRRNGWTPRCAPAGSAPRSTPCSRPTRSASTSRIPRSTGRPNVPWACRQRRSASSRPMAGTPIPRAPTVCRWCGATVAGRPPKGCLPRRPTKSAASTPCWICPNPRRGRRHGVNRP
jgi:hypothetical protein